jgi:hypothetical protein
MRAIIAWAGPAHPKTPDQGVKSDLQRAPLADVRGSMHGTCWSDPPDTRSKNAASLQICADGYSAACNRCAFLSPIGRATFVCRGFAFSTIRTSPFALSVMQKTVKYSISGSIP